MSDAHIMTDQAAYMARAVRMEKALRDIEVWARAYPLSVFHKPDSRELGRAAAVLAKEGIRLDVISADAMRHVLDGIINIVKDGLRDEQAGDVDGLPPPEAG